MDMLRSSTLPAPTDATRRLRLERLIGTDETKGLRGSLANALRAKALGHTTGASGQPIDEAIATYERGLANFRTTLATLAVAS